MDGEKDRKTEVWKTLFFSHSDAASWFYYRNIDEAAQKVTNMNFKDKIQIKKALQMASFRFEFIFVLVVSE